MRRALVEDQQRQFLLGHFEGLLIDCTVDLDSEGSLSPESHHWIVYSNRVIAWLRGGAKPGAKVREFLEERLQIFCEDTDYEVLAEEHDAIAAAIEDLR